MKWGFPVRGARRVCPKTGMVLHAYAGPDPDKRVACFASHALLWTWAADHKEAVLILEDDVRFISSEVPLEGLADNGYGAIGINDPMGATRRAGAYHRGVQKQQGGAVVDAPWVDRRSIPQGLAGGSAYIIKPWAAGEVLDKAREIGAWPNDALLCKQLFPWLGQSKKYYTKVSGRPSTLAR